MLKYESQAAAAAKSPSSLADKITFGNREWEATSTIEKDKISIELNPLNKRSSMKPIKFRLETQAEMERWMNRLRRVCFNEATHGIEIQQVKVDHPLVTEKIAKRGELFLSVWDFAGQVEYYQNHHYFISDRTIFLVLWRMDKGEEGLKGLEFWLGSLSSHLPPYSGSDGFTSHTIFVIGTFLDTVKKEERPKREAKVKEIAKKAGLKEEEIVYNEVSCATLENMNMVNDEIVKSLLSHSYMGERIPPKSYHQVVQKAIKEMLSKNTELPLVDLDQVIEHCRPVMTFEPETLKKRALNFALPLGVNVFTMINQLNSLPP